ncbi:MAG: hypothetical protein ABL902_08805 [Gallionella sp.]|jgi:transcriptional regulator with XRE-family HTH domain
METNSEQLRILFSKRLTQELKRIGQPIGSPTQIARNFNQHFSGQPVSAQTIRKWLLAEAVPTQPKLLALASWLGVSAQWLRYGSGAKLEITTPLSVQQNNLLLSQQYAKLAQQTDMISLLEKLIQLSPRDIRIVEGVIQLMHADSHEKPRKR